MSTAPQPKVRRWRERLVTLAAVVCGVVVLVRLAIPLVLPPLLRAAIEPLHLSIEWERLDLSLFGGRVELWHTDLRPDDEAVAPRADPALSRFAHVEYVLLDIDTTALLTGRLRVHRVEIDGADAWLTRDADGELDLVRHMAGEDQADRDSTDAASDNDESEADDRSQREARPISLEFPYELDAVRAQSIKLTLLDEFGIDAAVDAPRELRLDLDLRASDLGSSRRPARIELDVGVPNAVDRLRLEGQARFAEDNADIELLLALDGLHPERLRSQLAQLGWAPASTSIDFTGNASLRLAIAGDDRRRVTAELHVGDIALSADGETALGFRALDIVASDLLSNERHISRATLDGLELRAARDTAGRMILSGLRPELRKSPSEAERTPASDPPASETDSKSSLRVDALDVLAAKVEFTDRSFEVPAEYELELAALTLRDLLLGNASAASQATLHLEAAASGTFDALTLDAKLKPAADAFETTLELRAVGLQPDAWQPALGSIGWKSELESGELAASLAFSLSSKLPNASEITALIESLSLTHTHAASAPGSDVLLQLDRVALNRLRLAPDLTRVGSLVVNGLHLPTTRDAAGAIGLLGCRKLADSDTPPARTQSFNARKPTAAKPSSAAVTATASTASPRLELDHVQLDGISTEFIDHKFDAPRRLALTRLDGLAERIALGAGAPREGTLELSLSVDDAIDTLTLNADVNSAESTDISARLSGTALTLAALRPYLDDAGVELELENAALDASLDATLQPVPAGWIAEAQLANVTLLDRDRKGGTTELAGIDAVRVNEVELSQQTRVGALEIERPRVAVERASDGSIGLLGLRFGRPAPADSDEPAVVAPPPPPPSESSVEVVREPAPESSAQGIQVGRVAVTRAGVAFDDQFVSPPTQLSPTLDIEIGAFATGAIELGAGETLARTPLRFELGLGADAPRLELVGSAQLGTPQFDLALDLGLDQLDFASLAAYVPANIVPRLEQHRLTGRAEFTVAPHESGGNRLHAALNDMALSTEGDADGPELAWKRLAFTAERLDAANGHVEIDEVALEELNVAVTRRVAGHWSVAGIDLIPTTDAADPAASTAAAPTEDSAATAAAATTPSASTEWLQLTIESVAFNVAQVRVRDESDASREALDLTLDLRSAAPLDFVVVHEGEAPGPPLELHLSGGSPGFLDQLEGMLAIERADTHADVQLALALEGLHGSALVNSLPFLENRLDASGLEGGSAHLDARVAIDGSRRGAFGPDLARRFDLEAQIERLELRATPNSPRAIGFDSILIDAPGLDPSSSAWIIDRVEIERPSLHASQSERGLEFSGLTFLKAADSDSPSDVQTDSSETAVGATESEPDTASTTPRLSAGVRELTIRGADIVFEDNSKQPPVRFPVEQLDVEVRGATTDALRGSTPLRFDAFIGGGDVALPKREPAKSILTGIAGAAVQVASGSTDEFDLEDRPAFDAVSISGRLQLGAAPRGWTRVSIEALELPTLRGLAASSGVEIGDGTLDMRTRLRFKGERGLHLDNKATFGHLSLSEPADGPISQYLSLPAPLDSVLFLLEDRRGDIVLPTSIDVGADGVGTGAVMRAATGALASVIANAVLGAPMRSVGTVTGMLGVDINAAEAAEPIVVELDFRSASTRLDSTAQVRAAEIVSALRKSDDAHAVVEHQFGVNDVQQAELLANPDRDEARAFAEQLRARRDALLEVRLAAKIDAGTALALGQSNEATVARRHLTTIDGELLDCEAALDSMLALLDERAERRRDRRTRDAALAIAEMRLNALRRAIEAELANAEERVEYRAPRLDTENLAPSGRIVGVVRGG